MKNEEKNEEKGRVATFMRDMVFSLRLIQFRQGKFTQANAEAGFLKLDGCHPIAAAAQAAQKKEEVLIEIGVIRDHWSEHGETPLKGQAVKINEEFPVEEQQEINKKRREAEKLMKDLDKRQQKLNKVKKKKKQTKMTEEPPSPSATASATA